GHHVPALEARLIGGAVRVDRGDREVVAEVEIEPEAVADILAGAVEGLVGGLGRDVAEAVERLVRSDRVEERGRARIARGVEPGGGGRVPVVPGVHHVQDLGVLAGRAAVRGRAGAVRRAVRSAAAEREEEEEDGGGVFHSSSVSDVRPPSTVSTTFSTLLTIIILLSHGFGRPWLATVAGFG